MARLLLGPDPGPHDYTDEELRLAWEAYGASLHGDDTGDEPVRLAELGLLTGEELAAIAESAGRARERLASGETFYHGADVSCRRAVDLGERVQEALNRRG